jgi:hypothetical protein
MATQHQAHDEDLKLAVSKEEALTPDIAIGVGGDEPAERFTEEQTKRLLHKIDLHMIPYLSLLYLLSFLE